DLRKPLLRQVWEANWRCSAASDAVRTPKLTQKVVAFSKSYYLQQVHQPRHLAEPARFFGPGWLEIHTRTAWYVVPLFWGPITLYLFLRSVLQWDRPLPRFTSRPMLPIDALTSAPLDSYAKTLLCFFVGNAIWTLLEYIFHRFLFHVDALLPDR